MSAQEKAPGPFAGTVTCLGFCGQEFWSEDRRYNRMCSRCKHKGPDIFHGQSVPVVKSGKSRRAPRVRRGSKS